MREYQLPHNLLYASIEHTFNGDNSNYGWDEDEDDDDDRDRDRDRESQYNPSILYVFSPSVQTVKYEKHTTSPEDFYEHFCLDCNWKPYKCIGGYTQFKNRNCPAGVELPVTETIVPINLPMHCFAVKSGSSYIYTHYFYNDKTYPLQISNVYPDGHWCQGSLDFDGYEMDITDIYTKYWEVRRNGDLPVIQGSYQDHIEAIARDFQYLPDLQDRKLDIPLEGKCGVATDSLECFSLTDKTLTYQQPKTLCVDSRWFTGSVRVSDNEYIRFN